ncbi:hypothetical protein CMV_020143, partial [Castanea mollissima]
SFPSLTKWLVVSTKEDGTYTMKKVLIQTTEQLELVREEIRVSSLFSHPNLLPLLDHAILSVKGTKDKFVRKTKEESNSLFTTASTF